MADMLFLLAVFAFSFLVGHFLISKVPALLHTPLMSMTNAISAVTILGALLLFSTETGITGNVLGAAAIAMAAFNLVGGFVITHHMLKLFKEKEQPRQTTGEGVAPSPPSSARDGVLPSTGQKSRGFHG